MLDCHLKKFQYHKRCPRFPHSPILTSNKYVGPNVKRINAFIGFNCFFVYIFLMTYIFFNSPIHFFQKLITKEKKRAQPWENNDIIIYYWKTEIISHVLVMSSGDNTLCTDCLHTYLKKDIFTNVSNEQNIFCVSLVHTNSQRAVFCVYCKLVID